MTLPKNLLWGDFIFYGDQDLLSFALLYSGGLAVPAMFHASQVIEKYLKALALSTVADADDPRSCEDFPWLKTMDLGYLAQKCATKFPFYIHQDTLNLVYRYARFDKVARFPWHEKRYGSGFTVEDQPVFFELVSRLRRDINIPVDDFPLGLLVRGFPQNSPKAIIHRPIADLQRIALATLRKTFRKVDEMVRWEKTK